MQIQLHGRFSDGVVSDDMFEWIVGFCVAILSTSSIVISRVCALASRIDILTRINNRNLFVFFMFANLRHINNKVKNNQLEGFNTVLEISNLTL